LSDNDKKVFLVVIPLQIIANIALLVIEDLDFDIEPSTQATWRNVLRLVDLVCCGAILIPIIWSIKHLREAADVDGKAAISLNKLQLFRQFYLMVVAYIYFTQILIYMVQATLPPNLSWLRVLFAELSTLIFVTVTGYKFRPVEKNPYLQVEMADVGSAASVQINAGSTPISTQHEQQPRRVAD